MDANRFHFLQILFLDLYLLHFLSVLLLALVLLFAAPMLDHLPTKDANFGAYKVTVTHQTGHFSFGTYLFGFDRPGQVFRPLRSNIRRGMSVQGQVYGIEMDTCIPGEMLATAWIPPSSRGIDVRVDGRWLPEDEKAAAMAAAADRVERDGGSGLDQRVDLLLDGLDRDLVGELGDDDAGVVLGLLDLGDGAHLGMRVRYSWEHEVLGSAGGPRHALPLLQFRQFVTDQMHFLSSPKLLVAVEVITLSSSRQKRLHLCAASQDIR